MYNSSLEQPLLHILQRTKILSASYLWLFPDYHWAELPFKRMYYNTAITGNLSWFLILLKLQWYSSAPHAITCHVLKTSFPCKLRPKGINEVHSTEKNLLMTRKGFSLLGNTGFPLFHLGSPELWLREIGTKEIVTWKKQIPPKYAGQRVSGKAAAAHLGGKLLNDRLQIVAPLNEGFVYTIRLQSGLRQTRREIRSPLPERTALLSRPWRKPP